MNSKRILAILLSLCMLLVLVPAVASADEEEPAKPIVLPMQGSHNNVLTKANLDNAWKYNTTFNDDGSISIGQNGDWGKEAWQEGFSFVAADVSALNGKDYVITWQQTLLGYIDDGPHLMTRVGSTTDGVIMLVTTSDKIYINLGGELTQISDVDKISTAHYSVYVKKEADDLTSLYIFADFEYVGKFDYEGAVSPMFGMSYKGCYWAAACTISDYAMYDTSVIFPEMGDKTNVLTKANIDNMWKSNTTINDDGSIVIGGGADWGKESWQDACSYVASDVSALNGKDYVITWTQSHLSWADGGPHLMTRVGSTDGGVIHVDTTSADTYITLGNMFGTVTKIAEVPHTGSATYAVYVKKISATLTTIYVFANGTLLGTYDYAGAVNPIFGQSYKGYGWAGDCTISNLAMYSAMLEPPALGYHTNVLTKANIDNIWKSNATINDNGSVVIGGSADWGKESWQDTCSYVAADVSALNGKDYVITWTQSHLSWLEGGVHLMTRVGSTPAGVIQVVTTSADTSITVGSMFGTVTKIAEVPHLNAATYTVYVKKTALNVTTIFVFGDGALLGTYEYFGTISPMFGQSYKGYGWAGDCTVSNLAMYSDEPVITHNVTVTAGEGGTVSGNTTAAEGSSVTVVATPADGYNFVNWTVDGDEVSTDAEYTFTLEEDVELVATFEKGISTYDVIVNSVAGGYGDGEAYGVEYGDEVTLTAYADDGFVFRYWLINGRIFNGETVVLAVNSNIDATPVFVARESNTYTIHFYTADGRLIMTADSGTFDAYRDLPAVPARYGYVANDWDYVWEDGITSDIDVYPQYTKIGDYYTISVTGGKTNKSSAQFESFVTVRADAEEGFCGWQDATGKYVSITPIYTFFAVQDVELTAVYNDEKVPYVVNVKPTSDNEDASDDTFTINIIGETHVAEGYTIIERGILYATGDQTESSLVIGGKNVKQKMASTANNGQFMYTLKNAPKAATITARVYMIVKNAVGEQTVAYSGLCDATFAG